MMSWDYLLGLTTEFTECSEVEKRGGDENQSFEMIGNASFPFVSSVFSVFSVVKFSGWLWVRF